MPVAKITTRETEGIDQTGKVIGKPKGGDVVKVHYSGYTLKENGKKGTQFIDTAQIGKLVCFRVTKKGAESSKGLYVGLNEAVKSMNLGEEAQLTISSDMAFGEEGLPRYFNPSSGFAGSGIGVIGVAKPNDPKAPPLHHGRNPLCIAYIGIPGDKSVYLELALMEINGCRRAIPDSGCLDCLVSSISGAFGLNSGTA